MKRSTQKTTSHKKGASKTWVRNVKTVSTFPPKETFNQPAEKVAKVMAQPKVSPKGLGSAIKMIQYFINRGGKNLPAAQKRELEKAKHILQEKREKDGSDERGEKQKPSKKRSHRHASTHSKKGQT